MRSVLSKVVFGAENAYGTFNKYIEDIQIGDMVLSYNETTGQKEYRRVYELFVHDVSRIYEITYSDGSVIETTYNHPFYIQRGVASMRNRPRMLNVSFSGDEPVLKTISKGWIEARDIRTGDSSIQADGSLLRIVSVDVDRRYEKVYNFEVEGTHTYYVGKSAVLVHNYPTNLTEGGDVWASFRAKKGDLISGKIESFTNEKGKYVKVGNYYERVIETLEDGTQVIETLVFQKDGKIRQKIREKTPEGRLGPEITTTKIWNDDGSLNKESKPPFRKNAPGSKRKQLGLPKQYTLLTKPMPVTPEKGIQRKILLSSPVPGMDVAAVEETLRQEIKKMGGDPSKPVVFSLRNPATKEQRKKGRVPQDDINVTMVDGKIQVITVGSTEPGIMSYQGNATSKPEVGFFKDTYAPLVGYRFKSGTKGRDGGILRQIQTTPANKDVNQDGNYMNDKTTIYHQDAQVHESNTSRYTFGSSAGCTVICPSSMIKIGKDGAELIDFKDSHASKYQAIKKDSKSASKYMGAVTHFNNSFAGKKTISRAIVEIKPGADSQISKVYNGLYSKLKYNARIKRNRDEKKKKNKKGTFIQPYEKWRLITDLFDYYIELPKQPS